jgi:Leucine Rich repeat
MTTAQELVQFIGDDEELWRRVCAWATEASDDTFSSGISLVERRLESVPDDVRRAPPSWVHKAIVDGGYPPMHLIRSIHARSRSSRDRGSALDDSDLQRLVRLPEFGLVSRLKLFFCGITDAGAEALSSARYGSALTSLNLAHNRISGVGAAAIVGSPQLPALAELRLGRNHIGDGGVFSIAAVPGVARLRLLDLSNCPLTDEGIEALRRALPPSCELVVTGRPPKSDSVRRHD